MPKIFSQSPELGNLGYTAPVGSFAPNGYGLYDMAGNAFEWCNDRWSDTYYSSSPYSNPRGPVSGTVRVLRGGSWGTSAYECRAASHDPSGNLDIGRSDYGFRVALDAE